MSLNAKVVIEVGVGLALWFGFIINMAIATGLRREMQLDVENDKSRIVWFPGTLSKIIRQYREQHPGTMKPRQMWLANIIAILCFMSIIVMVLLAAWRMGISSLWQLRL
jgi:hypothetical protein